jgi:hypothetical protein
MSFGPGLRCVSITGGITITERTCCSFRERVDVGNWKRYKIGDRVVVALRFRLLQSLFHSREPCRQVRERSRAPTQLPSSKRHALPSSPFAPLFSLSQSLLTVPFLIGCAKLSRRLARYHLAMALFPSPRASRSVTVSVSRELSSSQACCLKATSDMQCHSDSPHCAYRMATAYRPPVPLRASGRSSRLPW